MPGYALPGDAGADLFADVNAPVPILPGERKLIPTGVWVELPPGYELQIRSRSGLALKDGLVVLNAPGTIDSGYRGEIGVILANLDDHKAVTIRKGMRIAQAVLAPVVRAVFLPVAELSESDRGTGGFGSTGHG